MDKKKIQDYYGYAKERYAAYGVDTDKAVREALAVPISVHCWQGDDLTGFISGVDALSDGGILATGDFPGKAKTPAELREDLDRSLGLVPGKKRVSLHAVYAESEKRIDLEEIDTRHFQNWIDWGVKNGYGLDFNPTCFSHPMLRDGYSLASLDEEVRVFWVDHVKRTRKIASEIGLATGSAAVNNIWVPDGAKDDTILKKQHRGKLLQSLDEILSVRYPGETLVDTVESKLFGIGSESFVAGSHEFYLLYAASRNIVPCMDMGHFHPTESVADKISAMLLFFRELQIHTSRGVRWDSDHVAIWNDELSSLMKEINRAGAFENVRIALDYFDGSINRLMAWVVGARATRKAILSAMLEPVELLAEEERNRRYGARLSLLEEMKSMPFGAVWDWLCVQGGVPAGSDWLEPVERYERDVLAKRK